MPRVNTYEPTELEALETAHDAVLYCIQVANEDTPANEAYHNRLRDSSYWIRRRLDLLRKEAGRG